MKKFLFAVLTTLFVSAMPFQTAYATADDANKVPTEQACEQPYAGIVSEEDNKKVIDNGGEVINLEGAQAAAFLARVEELVNSKAPFTPNRVLAVHPDGEDDTSVNIAFFVNDCLVHVMHLPFPVFSGLLSPNVPKTGERVD